MTENKHERFKRLAAQRTNNVLRYLKILGNCSNRSVYDYTPEEINKIFAEIDRKVRDTKAQFRVKRDNEFKL